MIQSLIKEIPGATSNMRIYKKDNHGIFSVMVTELSEIILASSQLHNFMNGRRFLPPAKIDPSIVISMIENGIKLNPIAINKVMDSFNMSIIFNDFCFHNEIIRFNTFDIVKYSENFINQLGGYIDWKLLGMI